MTRIIAAAIWGAVGGTMLYVGTKIIEQSAFYAGYRDGQIDGRMGELKRKERYDEYKKETKFFKKA